MDVVARRSLFRFGAINEREEILIRLMMRRLSAVCWRRGNQSGLENSWKTTV